MVSMIDMCVGELREKKRENNEEVKGEVEKRRRRRSWKKWKKKGKRDIIMFVLGKPKEKSKHT